MTHPFHPMFGYEFELLDRRQAWGEDRVYFRDKAGAMMRMPAEWTSAGAEDPFLVFSAGRSFLRVSDLLHWQISWNGSPAPDNQQQRILAVGRCQANDAENVRTIIPNT